MEVNARFPGHVWTYDFTFDQTLNGTILNILTDELSRQSLALRAAQSFASMDVKDALRKVIGQRDAPGVTCGGNGPELIGPELGTWLAVQDIGPRRIRPGKPRQNGYARSGNSRLREERLRQEVFDPAGHARDVTEDWRAFSTPGSYIHHMYGQLWPLHSELAPPETGGFAPRATGHPYRPGKS